MIASGIHKTHMLVPCRKQVNSNKMGERKKDKYTLDMLLFKFYMMFQTFSLAVFVLAKTKANMNKHGE